MARATVLWSCVVVCCAVLVQQANAQCSCAGQRRLESLLTSCISGGGAGGGGTGGGNGGGLGTGVPDPRTTKLVVFNGVVTYYDALRNCKAKGGQLGVPRTLEEVRAMNTQARARHRQLWMGGDDQKLEGHWVDVNNNPLTLQEFAPGQPDSHRVENCLCLYFYTLSRSWNDCICKAHLRGYMCRLPR